MTLSSAEAELLAAVKASGEALEMLQLMSSVVVPMTASIMVDSSCSTGSRGRETANCVMSELDIFGCNGGLKYHKVNGEENPSDACTKHLTSERLRKLVARGTVPKVGASARVAPRAACADCAGRFARMPNASGRGESVSTSRHPAGVSHLVVIR